MVECVRRGPRLSPPASTDGKRSRSGLALAGTIGGYVAICIGVGLGLGLLVDRILHTAPLCLISGVVLGFAVSFLLTYKLAMRELI
jgi:F0F1-type ATP synthase assembly protein I